MTDSSLLSARAEEAFRGFLAGDASRLTELVELLTPPLWAVARSAGLGRPEAEDVVQSSWAALLRASASIEEPRAVFAWLLTTTRREAWRLARRPPGIELNDSVPEPGPGPCELAEEADECRRLWGHVSRLSPRCQALLRVIALASRPDYATISSALGMPVGSIGPTRGRCLAALRRALEADPAWSTT